MLTSVNLSVLFLELVPFDVTFYQLGLFILLTGIVLLSSNLQTFEIRTKHFEMMQRASTVIIAKK